MHDGRSTPALRAGTATGSAARSEHLAPSSPFLDVLSPVIVGRDAELDLLAKLALRPPSVAVIEGQAGVGKTRLVSALAEHPALEGVGVLIGRCPRLREPFVLGPMVDALKGIRALPAGAVLSPVSAALRPLLPELGHLLPELAAGTGSIAIDRHRLFRSVRELLEVLGPTLLIVEDLQWADEATSEMLGFLAEDPPSGLVVVVTCRTDGAAGPALNQGLGSRRSGRAATARVDLAPLPVEHVRTMVEAILDHAISAERAAQVHERTAGLPFAVEEVVRLGRDRGVFDSDLKTCFDSLDELGVPSAVRDSVLGQLAALGADARRVVAAAAVLEVPSDDETLAQVSGLAPRRAGTALCEALRAAVLVEIDDEPDSGLYGFRHPLATQAVYEWVPGPERKELHLRAADTLLRFQPRPLSRLAHHCRGAGRTQQWISYAEAAADLARERGDPTSAVPLLSEVLRAGPVTGAIRLRLALKLGRLAVLSGESGKREAIAVLRELIDSGLSGKAGVDVRIVLGELLTWSGDAVAGYDELVRCLHDLDGRPAVAAHVMAGLAGAPHLALTVGERLDWLDAASTLVARTGDEVLALEVRGARAALLVQVGDRDGWTEVLRLPTEATAPSEQSRLVIAWTALALACAYLGHYRRSQSYLERADRWQGLFPRLDRLRQSVELILRWSVGDWQGLEDEARAHAFANLDRPAASVPARYIVGSLALCRGDLAEAEQSLTECADRAEQAGLARSLAISSADLVRIALARGCPEDARRRATDAVAATTATGVWVRSGELVEAAVEASIACGKQKEARALVRTFASGLRRRDAPLARASLQTCRALLAEVDSDHEVAAQAFAAAERRWAALPRPHDAARVAARRGRCLLTGGCNEGGRVLLDARERFDRLGSVLDVAEASRVLAHFGVDVGPGPGRRGRRGAGPELTFRQAQVVELAGRGLTSAAIAEILQLSPRTVEDHVAASLRKLGVRSKRGLIMASRRLPLAGIQDHT